MTKNSKNDPIGAALEKMAASTAFAPQLSERYAPKPLKLTPAPKPARLKR